MKWRLQFNLAVAAFGTALTILVFINVLLFVSLDKNTQQDLHVVHTHEVIKTGTDLLSAVKDAETAQRGYIITKDPTFLQPYLQSIATKDSLLVKLERLTQDSPTQLKRLDQIKKLTTTKYQFIAQTITTLNQLGTAKTIDLVNNGQGKMIMDQLRVAFQQFNAHENSLLEKRVYAAQKSVNTLKFTLIYSTLISILIFSITFYKLFQKIKLQHQHEETLFVQNEWYKQ